MGEDAHMFLPIASGISSIYQVLNFIASLGQFTDPELNSWTGIFLEGQSWILFQIGNLKL